MTEMTYEQTVFILAPIDKVWDALTNPEITPQYMFGCAVVSDWTPGNSVVWKGANGQEYVKGEVVTFDPLKELAFTVFDPNAGYIDDPSNYLTTRYKISKQDGATRVDVSQGDYATVENGEKRFKESFVSWELTLKTLKRILED